MQTFSHVSPSRNGNSGVRKTVFEVFIPHLDESVGPSNAVNNGSSLAGSPIRGLSGSGDGLEIPSSIPASAMRAGAVPRADSTRYSSVSSSMIQSNRQSFMSDGDVLLPTHAGTLTSATVTTNTNPLTKPTLAPSSIRCCRPDQWVPDAHVVNCMAPDCRTSFSLFNRKYHCKMCGRVFCSTCCSFVVSIPNATGPTSSAMAASAAASSALTTAANSVTGLPPNSSLAGAAAMNSLAAALSNGPYSPTTGAGGGATTNSPSFFGFGPLSGDVTASSAALPATSSAPGASSTFRVCNSCRYELHLVIPTRQENGERRRKSRGELKMFQWALVVNILSYLPLPSLLEMALVSSDFYFMSKDNVVWYQYNMMRWLKDAEQTQTQLSIASSAAHKAARSNFGFRGGVKSGGPTSSFQAAPVLQDATALTESEAAKRVISLHARYNFTQFLDFTRRQEMARCEGLSSFSVGSRILLSSPVKIALIGPSSVGKTASVRHFVGQDEGRSAATDPLPTVGFVRYVKTIRLVGDITTEVTLHIYDVSGAPRYEALRRFICAQCHAVGLCYDPTSKVTLVEAADVMMGLEAALGPQPVVVCGLLREANATGNGSGAADLDASGDSVSVSMNPSLAGGMSSAARRMTPGRNGLAVTEDEAVAISVRTAGSLQCPVRQCESFYKKLIQCLLDRLALATMVGNATVADISGEVTEASSINALRRSGGIATAAAAAAAVTSANGVSASAVAGGRGGVGASAVARRPKASKVTAQELLNLTMQPCALDILLDPK